MRKMEKGDFNEKFTRIKEFQKYLEICSLSTLMEQKLKYSEDGS